jgi:uncharacterized membrane protein YbhN (UPF0104 family)
VVVFSRYIITYVSPAVASFSPLALVMMLQLHGSTAAHVVQLDDIISIAISASSSLLIQQQ